MPRRREALAALAVFLAALLVHVRSLAGQFVYDDHRFIEHNAAIATLRDPARFFTDPATASADTGIEPDIWRPLRTLDFAVDRAVFGLHPFGWHLVNVLLHALNAFLVWMLLLRLLGCRVPAAAPAPPPSPSRKPDGFGTRRWAAFFGALLFAVHPVTSESVAWVSSRGDLLAVLLMLLAFEVLSKAGAARTVIGAALAALAVLAKESAIVAAPLLFLIGRAAPEAVRLPLRTRLARVGILLGVGVLYFLARNQVLPGGVDREFLAQTTLPDGGREALARGMLAGLAWYAKVLAWPAGFGFDFRQAIPPGWSDPALVVGLGLLLTVLALGVRALMRRDGVIAFACFGSLVALAPVSNVIVPLKALVAERFLYPVLPCVAVGVAYGLSRLLARGGATRTVTVLASVAAVSAIGIVTLSHDAAWNDEESLWTAVRDEDPTSARAYEGLGFVYVEQGHLDRSERTYRTYREWQPDDGKSLAVLGDLYSGLAEALTTSDEEMLARTNVPAKRRLALRAAIAAYQEALTTWDRVGLVKGRGSEAIRRKTLERLRAAALDAGALDSAKIANDLLAGPSPGFTERGMRLVFAALVLMDSLPMKPEERASERVVRTRAVMLRDAGVDPNLSDPDAAEALVAPMTALLRERPGELALHRNRGLLLLQFVMPRRTGSALVPFLEAAVEDMDAVVAADPTDPDMRQIRDDLRARLQGARPQ